MIQPAYEYRATVIRVVDGDTVHADVDLGFDAHLLMTLRLAGIDAPEVSTEAGRQAKQWLIDLVGKLNGRVVIRTEKDRREKYGRYLATLYTERGVSINDTMVAQGQAVPYTGGKR